ncbi:MAG TPA: type I restriction endonuclease [Burkholderiales bacterium]|nr:type I restriction endonuclease [Burkholderiales bacterium]
MIDFDDPAGNDWLAVSQFSVTENKHSRRPDVVLFVNGLPRAVVHAAVAGGGRGHLRAAPLPRPGARLHRLRRRRERASRQEDGGLPPVPCSAGGRGRDAPRGEDRSR